MMKIALGLVPDWPFWGLQHGKDCYCKFRMLCTVLGFFHIRISYFIVVVVGLADL